MGFGLITIGFLALLLVDYGIGGVIAGITLAYGFYVLTGHDGRFRLCVFSSAVMAPCALLKLMFFAGLIDETVNTAAEFAFHIAWGVTAVIYLWGIMKIVQANGARSFEFQAKALLYVNVIYFVVVLLEAAVSMGSMGYVLIISKYLLVFLNTLFAHKCFTHISTEERTKRDLKRLEDEDRRRTEKKKKQQERLDKIREGLNDKK